MHRLTIALSSLLTIVALLALPTSALAAVDYGVIHDYCGGPNSWTTHFKARVISDGTSPANKLTIDSWVQARDPGHPHWYRAQTWPRVSMTFTPNGAYHQLTLARHVSGGVDLAVRIVYKMSAWDHGLVFWTQQIHSVTC